MKISKKLLSLLLCVVMVLGSVAVGGEGFAEVLDAFSVKASAASFSPRTTAPSTTDSHWIQTSKGGSNECILISGNSVLPNCVGYAWGRAYEILGHRPALSTGMAYSWYNNTSDGYSRGSTPKLGAIACWSGGSYGHVAVVEAIESNNSIWVSESNYEGSRFEYNKINPSTHSSGFQGYIYIGDFSLTAPQKAVIYTDYLCYKVNENVTFHFDTDASPNCNVIWIYKPDGTSEYATDLGTSYTRKFSVGGFYEAVVVAWNGIGSKESKRISFYIGPPLYSKISTDKSTYTVGETVYFTFDTAATPNCNVIWIYKPDGTSEYVENLGNSYSKSFSKTGKYEAHVDAWNGVGSKSSSRISFTVVDKYYTVTYNANGGSGAPSNQTKTYGKTLTLSSTKPTRTGYTFKNWNTKSDGTGTSYSAGASYTANSAVTLYAQWTANTYTVSYNANGGSGVPANQTKTYGKTLTLSSTKPTRTGYTFKNWNTKSDGTGTSYSAGSSYTANSAVTFYAQWTANTYTVTYNANGGSGAPSNQTKTYGKTLTLSSTKPTRTGYTFKNWNTKADGTGTSYSSGASYTANAAVTLYAQWTPITYTVTYDANGGSGVPSSQTKTYGTTLTLSSTKPTRTGYTFKNWNTKSDGTGTSYSAGASYTANSAVTLCAQWTPITYTVTYDANGGSGVPSSQTKTYDAALTLSSTKPTRTGYTFKNWNTKADGTGTSYSAGASFTANAAVTLYAQWTENHTHNYTKSVTKPTCTQQGYTTYTCTCGDTYKSDYTDALGHNYVNGVCTRCGAAEEGYSLKKARESAKAELDLLKNDVASDEAKTILENAKKQIDAASSEDEIFSIKTRAIKSAIEADLKSGNNVFDKAVINVASEKTIDYRSKVVIKATAQNVPAGYHLMMVVDGKEIKGTNTEVTYEISELTRDVNYSVKVVDENGAVQKDSSDNELRKDGGKITCKAGFFQKLIAFFKGLFGSLPKVEVKPQ